MTDAPAPRRLAELYRASMAQMPAVDHAALHAALAEPQCNREVRAEILSAAVANPAQAAVIRTLTALRPDAEALRQGLVSQRRHGKIAVRPHWAALAASLALAAVLVAGLQPGRGPAGGVPDLATSAEPERVLDRADRISSVSFEGSSEGAEPAALFSGSFDS